MFATLAIAMGCTADVQATQDAGVPQGHHVAKTAALFSCRQACFTDIPYNLCADQRDACIANAQSNTDVAQCKKMSRTCRHQRRSCLRQCNAAGNHAQTNKPITGTQSRNSDIIEHTGQAVDQPPE